MAPIANKHSTTSTWCPLLQVDFPFDLETKQTMATHFEFWFGQLLFARFFASL